MLIWEDNREMEIWDGHGELLWIMDSYFGQKQRFKVKRSYWWICFLKKHSFSVDKT